MFCGECGTKLEEGMRFCPECGTPVKMPDFSQAAAEKPQELPAPEPELEPEGVPEAEPLVEAVPEPAPEVAAAPVEKGVRRGPQVYIPPQKPKPERKPARTGPQVYMPPQSRVVPQPAPMPEPAPSPVPMVEPAPMPEEVPQAKMPDIPAAPAPVPMVEPAPMPEEAPQAEVRDIPTVPAPMPMPEEVPQAKMPEMPAAPEPMPMPEEAPQARMQEAPAAMPRAGKLIAEFDKGGGNMIRYFDDHIEFDGISVAYADIDYADEEASTTSARGLVFASHYHGHIEFVLKNGEKRKLKVSGTSVYGIGGSGGAKKRFHAIREPFYSVILTYLGERKAREIEQGATVVVGGVSVSPERMDVTKALGHKELTLSREEFGSAVLRTFDIMIRKKDGSKWTTIYRRIPNANILPYVLNRVYGNSTAPVTLEEEQPGMNEET